MKLIMNFFFFTAFNLACVMINDPVSRLFVASVLGIVQTVVLVAITREYNPLNLFPMTMLLWMAWYPLSGIVLLALELPLNYGVTADYLGRALILANVSQLVVASVWRMRIWPKIARTVPRPSSLGLEEASGALFVLWVVYLVVKAHTVFSGYQPGFEVVSGTLDVSTNLSYLTIAFLGLTPVLLFCSVLKRKGRYASQVAALIVLVEVIFTFFAGTKAGPIITLIGFAVGYHYVINPINPLKAWSLAAIALVALFPFYAIKANVREAFLAIYGLDERPQLSLQAYMTLYSYGIGKVGDSGAADVIRGTAVDLAYRVDVLSVLASTMSHYDAAGQYDTVMYLGQWIKPYIPRFIWPDKGWVGLSLFVSNVILGIPTYTHAAVTSTIEGYIADGVIGALILACIHGAFVSFAYAYLTDARRKRGDSFMRAYFAAIYLVILYFNHSFAFPRAILINLVFLWLLVKFLTWQKARSVQGRSTDTRAHSLPVLKH